MLIRPSLFIESGPVSVGSLADAAAGSAAERSDPDGAESGIGCRHECGAIRSKDHPAPCLLLATPAGATAISLED